MSIYTVITWRHRMWLKIVTQQAIIRQWLNNNSYTLHVKLSTIIIILPMTCAINIF